MDLDTITIQQFKDRFYRDFQFAEAQENAQPQVIVGVPNPDFIQDRDIQNAYDDAKLLLNQGIIGSANNAITIAYLYLSAHCLCLNIKAADAGVDSNGTGGFPVNSRTVGSVSESYDVPQAYSDDPILSQYTQTAYGVKYLNIVLPYLRGNIVAIFSTGGHAAR